MPLINKCVHDCPLQHMPFLFCVTLLLRILVHDIGHAEQAFATVYTKFIAFGILFRSTVPAMLIALVIDYLVNMFLRALADNLRHLVALKLIRTNGQHREAVCGSSRIRLIRWYLHSFTLSLFMSHFCSFFFRCLNALFMARAHRPIYPRRFRGCGWHFSLMQRGRRNSLVIA